MTSTPQRILGALLLAAATSAVTTTSAATPPSPAAASHAPAAAAYLAKVNTVTITAADYEATLNEAARRKFYHGKPPEAEINALMREVADQMVNRILFGAEADRRKIAADSAKVEASIASYEARYRDSAMWRENRERLLPGLRERLEQDSRIERLERQVRDIPPPAEADVKTYYQSHPDKFTEPEKLHMSMILLQVDPSSADAVWKAAEEEAAKLRQQLVKGADFAELARLKSGDASAAEGGDLGYLHRGMVPEGLQGTIDDMKPGELSAPTRVLQGIAIFRLVDRRAPKHHDFETVRQRAADLLAREQSEQAWTGFVASLRKKTQIQLNTERYPALAAEASAKP